MKAHPDFCIEELQHCLHAKNPSLRNASEATILRALNFDLRLTRKNLTTSAREAAPVEMQNHCDKLGTICSFPEQLVLLDETSKDMWDALWHYAHSKHGTNAVVRVPFRRANRFSVLGDLEYNGVMPHASIERSCSRKKFHYSFSKHVVSHLIPKLLTKFVAILSNAKIDKLKELEDVFHQCGARFIFLPPYCPEINSIEVRFVQMKR